HADAAVPPVSLHDALPICKVAGIGGLERRIGQTLAGAVGGDEVLQHVQAFAEAGENRVLDDFVSGDLLLGLGHEAAHAGKLLDLDRKSTRLNSSHVKISYA